MSENPEAPNSAAQGDVDFVGVDDGSPANKCPAVLVVPGTGDILQVGRRVTDPGTLAQLARHTSIADDEVAIWTPANLKPSLLEALTGAYEPGQTGPGEPAFEDLLAATERSVVHLEARDTYDATDPAFVQWQQDGDTTYPWDAWIDLVGGTVARGVRFRRLRIVSEPISDYIRWEHAISYGNLKAGEELRWLPRHLAYDLPHPVADFFMYDHRLIAYNFTAGDGTDTGRMEYVADPRKILPIVGMYEMLWERAIPHADYTPS
ncbi:hypothetical protein NE236_30590 [Actinoallomurus purpureus]|uniref:DUF6879 family protein n=1 Tax=Actinoallomurus purpureus TaxID=478114 RepID=UPI002092C06A|nr:DUF6879 family protein [Actinoallomurus purpureus]MCO6009328.1 hypothetical protein [Actinoallomurus purpureus]